MPRMNRQQYDEMSEKVQNYEYLHGVFIDMIGEKEIFPYMRKTEDLERWYMENQHFDMFKETITLSKESWEKLSEIVTRKPCINGKIERLD
jgi:hypothetical protein